MNFARLSRTTSLIGLSVALVACTTESSTESSTPEIQSLELAQLSAGGGIAGYTFSATINGQTEHIGSLLVTEDLSNGVYEIQKEYWRWDPDHLDTIETGGELAIDVSYAESSTVWDSTIVATFENVPEGWSAWTINREFDLQEGSTWAWNSPGAGDVLYAVEADMWPGAPPLAPPSATYYLKISFPDPEDVVECDEGDETCVPTPPVGMVWYLEWSDYELWGVNQGESSENEGIYEVRLNDAYSQFIQTPLGVGFELKTVK